MKRGKMEMDNKELEEYIGLLSQGIKKQYETHKKRQRKFNKTLDLITGLLKTKDYHPSLIKQSKRLIE